MYLTKFRFVLEAHATIVAINNRHELHRDIQSMFNAKRETWNTLYRVVDGGKDLFLYVQSDCPPKFDASRMKHLEMISCSEIDSKLQSRIFAGDVIHFSIACCPSFKKSGDGKNSRRMYIRDREEKLAWLCDRLYEGGEVLYCLDESKESMVVHKPGHSMTIEATIFNGTLKVTDPDALLDLIREGIGPEKAYGCGLLMVA